MNIQQLMSSRIIKRIFFALFALLASITVYLSIVGIWAVLSVEELLDNEQVNIEQIQITEEQVSILLKVEDPTFYEHVGLDVSLGQGKTTITSSIARDIFLFRQKLSGVKGSFQEFYASVFQCCKKVDFGRDVMALVLNNYLPKEKQLSFYVSNSYMGSHNGKGVFGLNQASRAYYAKPLSVITAREFIGLVAMLKAPNYFHPVKKPEVHRFRTEKIEQVVSGKCKPSGWFDTSYEHCATDALI